MHRIHFTGELETGNKLVDEQHKRLFQIINEVREAIQRGKGPSVIQGTLLSLGEYASKHFRMEEGLMAQSGYPALEFHQRKHRHLTAQVLQFLDSVNAGEEVYVMDVIPLLSKWLQKHILVDDKKYITFLQGQNENRPGKPGKMPLEVRA